MRKITKQSLSKNNGVLDKLWRSVDKKEYCEVCVTLPDKDKVNYSQIHPHHVICRGHKVTRWDLKNQVWLCATHHTLGKYSAHLNAIWFSDWLKKNKPEIYKYLQGKQYVTVNYTLDELLKIYENLRR